MCKGKSPGKPRVSKEPGERIYDGSQRIPRKSTRRASRQLEIPQNHCLACVRKTIAHETI